MLGTGSEKLVLNENNDRETSQCVRSNEPPLWLRKVLPYNILVSISVQYDTKSQVDDPDDSHTKL